MKIEARTLARNPFARVGGKGDTFSDEFKITALRDMSTGTVSAEVKNTTVFPICKTSMGTLFTIIV